MVRDSFVRERRRREQRRWEQRGVGAGTVEAADGAFATGGAVCFRAKKAVAATATRTIATAETTICLVEFDLVDCFGWDDGEGTLAAGAEGAAAGTAAACGAGSCGSWGVVRILLGGTALGGTLLDGTLLGTAAGGRFPGTTGIGEIWLLSAGAGFGALRGGT